MFSKIATSLAIILGVTSGALAASNSRSINTAHDVYDTRGAYVGSDPDIHVRSELRRDAEW